ncbi:hypothetical protein AB3X91_11830 [Paraburkholderia sp. BR14263]|uniref:hypothetical protein n=1 Tax=unclassified Paraburkholderia TaxID=2615204 RepID=UPI0034CE15E0
MMMRTPMTLTVDVAALTVEMSGRYRNRPVSIIGPTTVDKTVLAVRRIVENGAVDEDRVEVEFFVPEGERGMYDVAGMKRMRGEWPHGIKAGILRTTAQVRNNPKTLAPFLASGEMEMTA